MTSALVASGQEHPATTSTSDSREERPSSVPISTVPPKGPLAKDSASRSSCRGAAGPTATDSRWPARTPPSIAGSSWYHAPTVSARVPGGPEQVGGTHADPDAPVVVAATTASAPTIAMPGPAHRTRCDPAI